MTNRHIVDRKLPERSRMIFYFTNPMEGPEFFRVEMPFFENPRIRESKKARFAKYSPVSRASNMYGYMGADSRKFRLTFDLTLPHILEEYRDITKDVFISGWNIVENPTFEKQKFKGVSQISNNASQAAQFAQQRYFNESLKASARVVLASGALNNTLNSEQERAYRERFGLNDEAIADTNVFGANTDNFLVDRNQNSPVSSGDQQKFKVIDLLIYWINIIRTSVSNNSENPIFGPPIIRLRHGVLFQNVPCICTDYSLEFDEIAGYDLDTLLPRRIVINMNLEELRTGDYGEFDQSDIVKRDNLTGWESVLSDPHSIDPGYDNLQ